jgi:hypothetical protein
MAADPYGAPRSRVADRPRRRAIEVKPKEVRYAVWLLWLCIPLWLPASIREYGQASNAMRSAEAVALLLILLVFVLLIFFINRGHNWARISFLVLTLLSLISLIGSWSEIMSYPPLYLGLNVALLLIEAIVLYLLFTRPGALWFRRVNEGG